MVTYRDGSAATLPGLKLQTLGGRSTTWGSLVDQSARYWQEYDEPEEEDSARQERWRLARVALAERNKSGWVETAVYAAEVLEGRYGLAVPLLMSPAQSPPYVEGRRAIMLALYDIAGLTMEQIGVVFAKHYASVSIGITITRERRYTDKRLAELCALAEQAVREETHA